MTLWSTLLGFIERDGRAALVTVLATEGSCPREAGARMAVRADGGFTGTIGGGTLEWLALAEAQALMARADAPPALTLDKSLGPDLGQCCGGRARLRIERFDATDRAWIAPLAEAEAGGALTTIAAPDASGRWVRRLAAPQRGAPAIAGLPDGSIRERFGEEPTELLLFGAGHVGRALVLALAPLPFRVTLIDPRPNAFPSHVPANVACRCAADPPAALEDAPVGSFVAVMSHSHALDLAIVAAALRDERFPYVGLIGSATKRARFSRQLRDGGLAPEEVGRLVCPIGLTAIAGKAPAVIAASIVAQLLIERERSAITAPRPPRDVERPTNGHTDGVSVRRLARRPVRRSGAA